MMKPSSQRASRTGHLLKRGLAVCATLALACTAGCAKTGTESATGPRVFASPDAAAQALYEAAKAGDAQAVLAIFGPTTKDLLMSGDPSQDKQAFKSYTDAYDQMHRWGELEGGDRVLIVGVKNYPFPFPLRKSADGLWAFDAEGGRQEFLARRIGDNELAVMGVLTAMTDAQREYFSKPRDDSKLQQYARRFVSSPGKSDGLYWPAAEGEPESPLGPLIAQATKEGSARAAGAPTPFHGYFFRILTEQGPHAEGGARNYIVDGNMTGGFALLAYPAEYRKTGVMSLLIDQDGELFQKNLGAQTTQVAESLASFDPDPSWSPVQ
jgi:hypothetical protein